jgi:hypothetical protein
MSNWGRDDDPPPWLPGDEPLPRGATEFGAVRFQ